MFFDDMTTWINSKPSEMGFVCKEQEYNEQLIRKMELTIKGWSESGVTVGYNGKYTCVHRIIWELFHGPIPDACVIDHLNGNPWDNRIENLACKTQTYNQRNRKIPKNNTSGIHGITIYESENILTVKVSVRFGKGVRFSKSFSVRKYGMENALKLAQDWRELKNSRIE